MSRPGGRRRVSRAAGRRRVGRRGVAALVTALWIPFPAGAVIVAGGDGTGNASAPSPDPGFSRLAIVAGLSGVYLGKGWILTAGHVLTAARNQKRFDVSLDGGDPKLDYSPVTITDWQPQERTY